MIPTGFLRLLGALALWALGTIGCVLAIAATGEPDTAGALLALAILILGYTGLSLSEVPHAPWRPLRLALGIATLLELYFLAGLPFPPRGAEAVSAAVWGTFAVATIIAALTPRRAPRLAAALIVVLALAAVFMCVRAVHLLTAPRPVTLGPAIVIAYVFAASTAAAWLSALWHGRRLLRRSHRADAS